MSVRVHLHWHTWRALTDGQVVVEVSGKTTGECLKDLVRQFPALGRELFGKDERLAEHISLFVNKTVAFPDELAAAVRDGDEIHVVPMIGGG
jgi:molybdopterin converting factor small subunit